MQERPGSVTAVGILSIIVGSLGLLLFCVCSFRVLVVISPGPNLVGDDLRGISGYVPMVVITYILNLILSSLFLSIQKEGLHLNTSRRFRE